MFSGHQLTRTCREPGYAHPGVGDPEPPPFMTVPTTCARAAVRTLHVAGAQTARGYLRQSKVGQWSGSPNASMASSNQNVLDGFDWYIAEDAADGRTMTALDADAVVQLRGIAIKSPIDVVLDA